MDKQSVIEETRHWIANMVIGLNLCPFAQRVFDAGRIRYTVSDAISAKALAKALADELKVLRSTPITEIETTILIHPNALQDFFEYNEFLDVADRMITEVGLEGAIQIASFHPEYQFAETDVDAVENYTNRSPYPMLHLLREASITQAAKDPDEVDAIPLRNIETLRNLGLAAILERLKRPAPTVSDPDLETPS
jgi:uncharacterized protein